MPWYYCSEVASSQVTSLTDRDPVSLGRIAGKIRQLHFAVNSVEEQYEDALALIEGLNIPILPKPVAGDFKVLHQRTETVLHHLADFFKISVDGVIGASADAKHRYHETLIHVFQYKDNPLTPILGCRHIQEILFAWKKWRNQWVYRKPHDEIESIDKGNKAFFKIPDLIRSLREAVSEANSIARHGVQVYRGEGREAEIVEVKGRAIAKSSCPPVRNEQIGESRGKTASGPFHSKETVSGFSPQRKPANKAKLQRPYGGHNPSNRGNSRCNAAPSYITEPQILSRTARDERHSTVEDLCEDFAAFKGGSGVLGDGQELAQEFCTATRGMGLPRRSTGSARGNH